MDLPVNGCVGDKKLKFLIYGPSARLAASLTSSVKPKASPSCPRWTDVSLTRWRPSTQKWSAPSPWPTCATRRASLLSITPLGASSSTTLSTPWDLALALKDTPNFIESFYSKTKPRVKDLLLELRECMHIESGKVLNACNERVGVDEGLRERRGGGNQGSH
ncbi:hypothetical protein AHAS_Ahas05G0104600 [Arachis hypogaea]